MPFGCLASQANCKPEASVSNTRGIQGAYRGHTGAIQGLYRGHTGGKAPAWAGEAASKPPQSQPFRAFQSLWGAETACFPRVWAIRRRAVPNLIEQDRGLLYPIGSIQ